MRCRVRRPVFLSSAFLIGAGLAGCGGGVYVGIGGGWGDEPEASLAVSPPSVRPGEVLRLVAAASDRDGIDDVRFYRLDADGNRTLLGSDGSAPYEWSFVVPLDASGSLQVQARARDFEGETGDSAVLSVPVLP